MEKRVEDLGNNPTDKVVWDLEASADGKLYGSTYPHAGLFEYDMASGAFRDYGTIAEEQQYARGIEVTDTHVYAGIGTTKHLFRVNRITGEKEEIVLAGHSGENGIIEDMFLVGDKLFVSVSTTTMAVVDTNTNGIIHTFCYNNRISKPSPYNAQLLYYKWGTKLYQYDLSSNATRAIEGLPALPDTLRVKDMAWITLKNGDKQGKRVLAIVTQYGEYMLYDPVDNELTFIALDIAMDAVGIQSLEAGPDGRLYLGGYQRGMSIYNPVTGAIDVNLPLFAQPEGIGFLDDKVYYGTYVGAVMYSYDPSKPADADNPKLAYDIGEDQDRPFAIAAGGNHLFVGTIPDYGVLGGALAVYNQTNGKWTQHRHVVRDQSIIGLAYRDGKLYGGTSIWGGLGIKPSAKEAKMFVWDVKKGRKIKEFTPDIPGIDTAPKMIGELSFGPDGNLWGIAEGTLFAMDPATLRVVKSRMIFPSSYTSSKWKPFIIEWSPDGLLYTTISRKLVIVDPKTLDYRVLVDQAMLNMTLGAGGSIYYALGKDLYRIAVPETDATLRELRLNDEPLAGFAPGITEYRVPGRRAASVEAIADQPGANVMIDKGQGDTLIRVTAPDGQSSKEYRIRWNRGKNAM